MLFSDIESTSEYQKSSLSHRMSAHNQWAYDFVPEEESGLAAYAKMVRDAEDGVTGNVPDPQITWLENFGNSALRGLGTIGVDLVKGVGLLERFADEIFLGKNNNPWSEEDDNFIYNAGERLDGWLEEAFPGNPNLQNDFLATILPQAAGSMVGFLIPTGAAGAAVTKLAAAPKLTKFTGLTGVRKVATKRQGLFGGFRKIDVNDLKFKVYGGKDVHAHSSPLMRKAVGALQGHTLRYGQLYAGAQVGALVGAGQEYSEAVDAGAQGNAMSAAMWGALVGSTEIAPIGMIFARASKPASKWFWNALLGGLEEASQEMISEMGYNWGAKKYYDQNRKLMEGLGMSGAAGGVLGMVMGLTTGLVEGRRAKHRRLSRQGGSLKDIRGAVNEGDMFFDFKARYEEALANPKDLQGHDKEVMDAVKKAGGDVRKAANAYAAERNIQVIEAEDWGEIGGYIHTWSTPLGEKKTSAIGAYWAPKGPSLVAEDEAWIKHPELMAKYPNIQRFYGSVEEAFAKTTDAEIGDGITEGQMVLTSLIRGVTGYEEFEGLRILKHAPIVLMTEEQIEDKGGRVEDHKGNLLREKSKLGKEFYDPKVDKYFVQLNGADSSGNSIVVAAGETAAGYEEFTENFIKRLYNEPHKLRVTNEFVEAIQGNLSRWIAHNLSVIHIIINNKYGRYSTSEVEAAKALRHRMVKAQEAGLTELNNDKIELFSDAIVFNALGYTHNQYGTDYSRLLYSFSQPGSGSNGSAGFDIWQDLLGYKGFKELVEGIRIEPQFGTEPITLDPRERSDDEAVVGERPATEDPAAAFNHTSRTTPAHDDSSPRTVDNVVPVDELDLDEADRTQIEKSAQAHNELVKEKLAEAAEAKKRADKDARPRITKREAWDIILGAGLTKSKTRNVASRFLNRFMEDHGLTIDDPSMQDLLYELKKRPGLSADSLHTLLEPEFKGPEADAEAAKVSAGINDEAGVGDEPGAEDNPKARPQNPSIQKTEDDADIRSQAYEHGLELTDDELKAKVFSTEGAEFKGYLRAQTDRSRGREAEPTPEVSPTPYSKESLDAWKEAKKVTEAAQKAYHEADWGDSGGLGIPTHLALLKAQLDEFKAHRKKWHDVIVNRDKITSDEAWKRVDKHIHTGIRTLNDKISEIAEYESGKDPGAPTPIEPMSTPEEAPEKLTEEEIDQKVQYLMIKEITGEKLGSLTDKEYDFLEEHATEERVDAFLKDISLSELKKYAALQKAEDPNDPKLQEIFKGQSGSKLKLFDAIDDAFDYLAEKVEAEPTPAAPVQQEIDLDEKGDIKEPAPEAWMTPKEEKKKPIWYTPLEDLIAGYSIPLLTSEDQKLADNWGNVTYLPSEEWMHGTHSSLRRLSDDPMVRMEIANSINSLAAKLHVTSLPGGLDALTPELVFDALLKTRDATEAALDKADDDFGLYKESDENAEDAYHERLDALDEKDREEYDILIQSLSEWNRVVLELEKETLGPDADDGSFNLTSVIRQFDAEDLMDQAMSLHRDGMPRVTIGSAADRDEAERGGHVVVGSLGPGEEIDPEEGDGETYDKALHRRRNNTVVVYVNDPSDVKKPHPIAKLANKIGIPTRNNIHYRLSPLSSRGGSRGYGYALDDDLRQLDKLLATADIPGRVEYSKRIIKIAEALEKIIKVHPGLKLTELTVQEGAGPFLLEQYFHQIRMLVGKEAEDVFGPKSTAPLSLEQDRRAKDKKRRVGLPSWVDPRARAKAEAEFAASDDAKKVDSLLAEAKEVHESRSTFIKEWKTKHKEGIELSPLISKVQELFRFGGFNEIEAKRKLQLDRQSYAKEIQREKAKERTSARFLKERHDLGEAEAIKSADKRAAIGVYKIREAREKAGIAHPGSFIPQSDIAAGREIRIAITGNEKNAKRLAQAFANAGVIPGHFRFYKKFEQMIMEAGGRRGFVEDKNKSSYVVHESDKVPIYKSDGTKKSAKKAAAATKAKFVNEYDNPFVNAGKALKRKQLTRKHRSINVKFGVWGYPFRTRSVDFRHHDSLKKLLGVSALNNIADNDTNLLMEAWLKGEDHVRLTGGRLFPLRQFMEEHMDVEHLDARRDWINNQLDHGALMGKTLVPENIGWPNHGSVLLVLQYTRLMDSAQAAMDFLYPEKGKAVGSIEAGIVHDRPTRHYISEKVGGHRVESSAVVPKKAHRKRRFIWNYAGDTGFNAMVSVEPDAEPAEDGKIPLEWHMVGDDDTYVLYVPSTWVENRVTISNEVQRSVLRLMQRQIVEALVMREAHAQSLFLGFTQRKTTRPSYKERRKLKKLGEDHEPGPKTEVSGTRTEVLSEVALKYPEFDYLVKTKVIDEGTDKERIIQTSSHVESTLTLRELATDIILNNDLTPMQTKLVEALEGYNIVEPTEEEIHDAEQKGLPPPHPKLKGPLKFTHGVVPDRLFDRQQNAGAGLSAAAGMSKHARANPIALEFLNGVRIHSGELNMGIRSIKSIDANGDVTLEYDTPDPENPAGTRKETTTLIPGTTTPLSMEYVSIEYTPQRAGESREEVLAVGRIEKARGPGDKRYDVPTIPLPEGFYELSRADRAAAVKQRDQEMAALRREKREAAEGRVYEEIDLSEEPSSKDLAEIRFRRELEQLRQEGIQEAEDIGYNYKQRTERFTVKVTPYEVKGKPPAINSQNYFNALGFKRSVALALRRYRVAGEWVDPGNRIDTLLPDTVLSASELEEYISKLSKKKLEEKRKNKFEELRKEEIFKHDLMLAEAFGFGDWDSFKNSSSELVQEFFGRGVVFMKYDLASSPSDDALASVKILSRAFEGTMSIREKLVLGMMDQEAAYAYASARERLINNITGAVGTLEAGSRLNEIMFSPKAAFERVIEDMLRPPNERKDPLLRANSNFTLTKSGAESMRVVWHLVEGMSPLERSLLTFYHSGTKFKNHVAQDGSLKNAYRGTMDLILSHIQLTMAELKELEVADLKAEAGKSTRKSRRQKTTRDEKWLKKAYPDDPEMQAAQLRKFKTLDARKGLEEKEAAEQREIQRGEALIVLTKKEEEWAELGQLLYTAEEGEILDTKDIEKRIERGMGQMTQLEQQIWGGKRGLKNKLKMFSFKMNEIEKLINQDSGDDWIRKLKGETRVQWQDFIFDSLSITNQAVSSENIKGTSRVTSKTSHFDLNMEEELLLEEEYNRFIDALWLGGKVMQRFINANPERAKIYEEILRQAEKLGYIKGGENIQIIKTEGDYSYYFDFEHFIRNAAVMIPGFNMPDNVESLLLLDSSILSPDPIRDTTFGEIAYFEFAKGKNTYRATLVGYDGYWTLENTTHDPIRDTNTEMHPENLLNFMSGATPERSLTISQIAQQDSNMQIEAMGIEAIKDWYFNKGGKTKEEMQRFVFRQAQLLQEGEFYIIEPDNEKAVPQGITVTRNNQSGDMLYHARRMRVSAIERESIPDEADRVITFARTLNEVRDAKITHDDHYVFLLSTNQWYKQDGGMFVASAEPAFVGLTHLNVMRQLGGEQLAGFKGSINAMSATMIEEAVRLDQDGLKASPAPPSELMSPVHTYPEGSVRDFSRAETRKISHESDQPMQKGLSRKDTGAPIEIKGVVFETVEEAYNAALSKEDQKRKKLRVSTYTNIYINKLLQNPGLLHLAINNGGSKLFTDPKLLWKGEPKEVIESIVAALEDIEGRFNEARRGEWNDGALNTIALAESEETNWGRIKIPTDKELIFQFAPKERKKKKDKSKKEAKKTGGKKTAYQQKKAARAAGKEGKSTGKAKVHKMSYKMPASQNIWGEETTTLKEAESGRRTSTTRSYSLGKVGDEIRFEGSSASFRITKVVELTEDNVNDPDFKKEWSEAEGWTVDKFDSFLKASAKTVKVGSFQTFFEKIVEEPDAEGMLGVSLIVPVSGKITRPSVKKDKDYLYIFTDNTDRTSGSRNKIPEDTWYAKKYADGKQLYYPGSNTTLAEMRGLDNAFPISTMKKIGTMKEAKAGINQWKESDLQEFKETIDAEIAHILEQLGNFKGLKYALSKEADQKIGQGAISKLPAKLQEYLDEKLLEIGINQGTDTATESVVTLATPAPARAGAKTWASNGDFGSPNHEDIDEADRFYVTTVKPSGTKKSGHDKRFSPKKAKLKAPGTIYEGKTIEHVYQKIIKMGAGKGKLPPTLTYEQAWAQYKALWRLWAAENPKLMRELRDKSKGKVLCDHFGATTNQARALAEIMNELNAHYTDYLDGLTNHTGDATGGDAWGDTIGRAHGVKNHKHYYIGAKNKRGTDSVSITKDSTTIVKAAAKRLNKKEPTLKNKDGTDGWAAQKIHRNWHQVKNVEQVVAIADIHEYTEVAGGTGWAIAMAQNELDKPPAQRKAKKLKEIFVFNLSDNLWYKWDPDVGEFFETDIIPMPAKDHAVIGKREEKKKGKQVIRMPDDQIAAAQDAITKYYKQAQISAQESARKSLYDNGKLIESPTDTTLNMTSMLFHGSADMNAELSIDKHASTSDFREKGYGIHLVLNKLGEEEMEDLNWKGPGEPGKEMGSRNLARTIAFWKYFKILDTDWIFVDDKHKKAIVDIFFPKGEATGKDWPELVAKIYGGDPAALIPGIMEETVTQLKSFWEFLDNYGGVLETTDELVSAWSHTYHMNDLLSSVSPGQPRLSLEQLKEYYPQWEDIVHRAERYFSPHPLIGPKHIQTVQTHPVHGTTHAGDVMENASGERVYIFRHLAKHMNAKDHRKTQEWKDAGEEATKIFNLRQKARLMNAHEQERRSYEEVSENSVPNVATQAILKHLKKLNIKEVSQRKTNIPTLHTVEIENLEQHFDLEGVHPSDHMLFNWDWGSEAHSKDGAGISYTVIDVAVEKLRINYGTEVAEYFKKQMDEIRDGKDGYPRLLRGDEPSDYIGRVAKNPFSYMLSDPNPYRKIWGKNTSYSLESDLNLPIVTGAEFYQSIARAFMKKHLPKDRHYEQRPPLMSTTAQTANFEIQMWRFLRYSKGPSLVGEHPRDYDQDYTYSNVTALTSTFLHKHMGYLGHYYRDEETGAGGVFHRPGYPSPKTFVLYSADPIVTKHVTPLMNEWGQYQQDQEMVQLGKIASEPPSHLTSIQGEFGDKPKRVPGPIDPLPPMTMPSVAVDAEGNPASVFDQEYIDKHTFNITSVTSHGRANKGLLEGRGAETVEELIRQFSGTEHLSGVKSATNVRRWKKIVQSGAKAAGEDPEYHWTLMTRYIEGTAHVDGGVGREQKELLSAEDVVEYIDKRPWLTQISQEIQAEQSKMWKEINDYWLTVHGRGADSGDTYMNFVNNYMAHLYKIDNFDKLDTWSRNKLKTISKHSEERSIPTYAEAQKMGYKPLSLNAGDIYVAYSTHSYRTLAAKALQRSLIDMTDSQGNRVAIARGSGEQQPPVLPPYARPRPLTVKFYDNKTPSSVYEKRDAPYLSKDGLWIHPDFVKVFDRLTYDPVDHRFVDGVEWFNAVMKKQWLSLSLFHPIALIESGFQTVGFGNFMIPKIPNADGGRDWKWSKMFRPWEAINEWIESNPEMLNDPIEAGLMVGSTSDVHLDQYKKLVNKMDDLTKRMPGVNHTIQGWRIVNDVWDGWLWDSLHTGMKLYAYYDIKAKILEKHGHELDWEDAAPQVASYINDAFGGLNWDMFNISGTGQRILKNLFLAPDWTSANMRIAFRPMVSKDFPDWLRPEWAKYWKRTVLYQLLGAALFQEAIKRLYAPDDDEIEDLSWNNPGEFGFGYVNVTPLIRKLPIIRELSGATDEENQRGAHFYTHGGKQWREVFRMFMDPNVYLGTKLTPAIQIAWEQISNHSVTGWRARWARDSFWDSIPDRAKSGAQKLLPFSFQGVDLFNDEAFAHGGSFMLATPINKEITEGKFRYIMNERLKYYLGDDDAVIDSLADLGVDLIKAAIRNGLTDVEIRRALSGSEVTSKVYDDYFKAWKKGDDREMHKQSILLLKLGKDMDNILASARGRGYISDDTFNYFH